MSVLLLAVPFESLLEELIETGYGLWCGLRAREADEQSEDNENASGQAMQPLGQLTN